MIRVNRHPCFGLLLVVGFATLYWLLCLPVAGQRGYPNMDPYYEYLVPYIWLLAPPLIPALDDRLWPRRVVRTVLLLGVCSGLGAVWANSIMATPRYFPPWLLLLECGACSLVIVAPYTVCLERVSIALWNKVRRFRESNGQTGEPPAPPDLP